MRQRQKPSEQLTDEGEPIEAPGPETEADGPASAWLEAIEQAVVASVAADLVTSDITSLVREEITSQTHSGPMPSPQTLAAYGEVLPTAPERMLHMAELTLRHQIRIEERASKAEFLLGGMGLLCAFITALVVLGGSIWLISDDKQLAGSVLATVDLVALVTVFIVGKRGFK